MVDQRIDRSRAALRQALFKLLLTRSYASVTIEEIAQCAGVARSTFYVHFKDKDNLLGASASGQTGLLSQLALEDVPLPLVIQALDHFVWGGAAALALLTSDAYSIIASTLASQIEEHLRARGLHRPGRLLVPPAMLGAMLANATLAGVRLWGESPRRMSSEDFARALARQSSALIKASTAGITGYTDSAGMPVI